MSVHHVGPFDLMYNIQLGKTIIAFVGLLVLNQVHIFLLMCQQMGLILVALGLTGAMGQVFIFVTISKFGALTCSIIGLARKITTLLVSIYVYKHEVNMVQKIGLLISVGSMIMNFWGKKGKGDSGHGHAPADKKAEQEVCDLFLLTFVKTYHWKFVDFPANSLLLFVFYSISTGSCRAICSK